MDRLSGTARRLLTKHKVVFLDVDGVICINDPDFRSFHPGRVSLLDEIIEALDAVIVITSSWRIKFTLVELKEFFHHQGVQCWHRIMGATHNKGLWRGDQINDFIAMYGIQDYIVIDDEAVGMEKLVDSSRFYKTKGLLQGLDREIVDRIIKERGNHE